jgi:hypothetical protein
VGLRCWIRSCCDVVLVGESAENRSAAHLVIGEVNHWWGLGFALGRCELSEGSVWPRVIEVVQIDREDPVQVAFVDDQDPVEQLTAQGSIMRSQIAFARGAPGGLVRIRMPSAVNTVSNALMNRQSRSRSRNITRMARSAMSISRSRAAWVSTLRLDARSLLPDVPGGNRARPRSGRRFV